MIIAAISGVLAGALIVVLILRLQRLSLLGEARVEASAIVEEANANLESLKEEAELRAEELVERLWSSSEAEIDILGERVERLEEEVRARRSQIDREYNSDRHEVEASLENIQSAEKLIEVRQGRIKSDKNKAIELRGELRKKLLNYIQRDTGSLDFSTERLTKELVDKELASAEIDAQKKASAFEEDIKLDSETIAKKLLLTALSRFQRPAPTERGIGVVAIPNPDVKKRMLGPEDENIKELEKLTGVGLTVTEKNTFQLASYDPVAREVTTRTLEKLLHEKAPTVETVRRLCEKTAGEVSRRVENDGHKIAAELDARDLHPEIKKRLGQLRYRYSFAQNQHFHVAEVGWLCGLLASELGGNESRQEQHQAIAVAKRSGLLHDVGKSMDHAIEGGHAVIGADFIAKHGESPEVVHAVKSHHYEEQPSTDLCYLVIAADAISGARPGARRSTVSLYNQKIEVLSNIADGFPGVLRTFIFNAGREVRIAVDGHKISDTKALTLCRQIADKIEDECQYPGQIKVVIVRETSSVATAR